MNTFHSDHLPDLCPSRPFAKDSSFNARRRYCDSAGLGEARLEGPWTTERAKQGGVNEDATDTAGGR